MKRITWVLAIAVAVIAVATAAAEAGSRIGGSSWNGTAIAKGDLSITQGNTWTKVRP